MKISIDGAGRVVIPKPMREQLGFTPDTPLEIEMIDGRVELWASRPPTRLVMDAHGPSFAATGTPLTDEDLRRSLEATRERV